MTGFNHKQLLTISEAAQMLGISVRKIGQMISNQELVSIKIGRCRRLPLNALQQWIEQQMEAQQ